MAQSGKFPAPVVCTCASLQSDGAGLNPAKKLQHSPARQRFAKDLRSVFGASMPVKRILGNIQPYNANLFHGRFLLVASFNTATLAQRCREGASTPSRGMKGEGRPENTPVDCFQL
jgi:hypothetical protein